MGADDFTPDRLLGDAGLSILPGEGYATLRLEFSRNMIGGQHLLRLEAVDPINPRRKPRNILRDAGIADVIIATDGEGAPELLEMIARALRIAADPRLCLYPAPAEPPYTAPGAEPPVCQLRDGHLERHRYEWLEWQTGADGPTPWKAPF